MDGSGSASPRELWRPSPGRFTEDELADALVKGGVAGPQGGSHDRPNVLYKIERLVSGEPDAQFGLRDLGRFSVAEVLSMMAEEAGFDPDPTLGFGPIPIDPTKVLAACRAAGRHLRSAADRRARVLLATGHPAGLLLLSMAVGELLEEHGATLVRPADGVAWKDLGRARQVRYFHGVAVLTDRGSTMHTHSPGPMQRMLLEVRPDLVSADHGFAGAAIEAGIDTVSIADVNDPAPVVAKRLGRTETVIVMDDNVQPESYWPCFQAIAEGFLA
jgi:hypothetical protein